MEEWFIRFNRMAESNRDKYFSENAKESMWAGLHIGSPPLVVQLSMF